MPAPKPLEVVLLENRELRPAPMTHDRLGRPLIGPCLIWAGKLDRYGYARVKNRALGDAPQLVHRVSYAVRHGVPFARMAEISTLDHLCRVTACSAPDHLEPTTIAENLRRGAVNQNAGKTECRRGHPFDEANTIRRKGGRRGCRACKRIDNRESWRRKNRPELLGSPALSASEAARRAGRAGHPFKQEEA